MQFQVPQFTDVEDTIIGKLTIKQFGVVAAGGIVVLALFKILGLGFFFYILAFPIAVIAVILAFGSFNGRKLYEFLPVILKYLRSDKTLIFQQKRPSDDQIIIKPLDASTFVAINAAAKPADAEPVQSRLRRLALQLDQKNREEFEALSSIRKQNGQR